MTTTMITSGKRTTCTLAILLSLWVKEERFSSGVDLLARRLAGEAPPAEPVNLPFTVVNVAKTQLRMAMACEDTVVK